MAALGVSRHFEDAEDAGQTHQPQKAHVHVEALDQHLVTQRGGDRGGQRGGRVTGGHIGGSHIGKATYGRPEGHIHSSHMFIYWSHFIGYHVTVWGTWK